MYGYAVLRASAPGGWRYKVLCKSTLGASDKLQLYVDVAVKHGQEVVIKL